MGILYAQEHLSCYNYATLAEKRGSAGTTEFKCGFAGICHIGEYGGIDHRLSG